VVYVTHDRELAATASRIVSVRDGLIVGDTGGRS
jgi:predicted ABC-type transport system involved in lysophospholipase L1 biosynthesis ATPase subunit